MDKPKLESLNLKNLFEKDLSIPEYQRAYEWKSEHVKNLLEDTHKASFEGKKYLMGTIILHDNEEKSKYDIIDGQQRLVTLSILISCLATDGILPKFKDAVFDNLKSKYYIKNTQNEINSFKNQSGINFEKYKQFLEEHLQFSILILRGTNALDIAYTFFDGVNSKGQNLSDFDLLKAHHLMFIPEERDQLARKHNSFWLSYNNKHKELFSSALRRIRMWSKGLNKDEIKDRNDYYEFISTVEPSEVEINEHLFNRYMQPNVFRSWHREDDEVVLNMRFPQLQSESLIPFEIPQTIEGGDSFFLYAKRYHEMFDHLFSENEITKKSKSSLVNFVYELSLAIDNEYLATAFKAIMLLYYDKFGENRLIEAATCVELIISEMRFEWRGQRPRPIRLETVLNMVKDKKLIHTLLNSTIASHVVSSIVKEIHSSERKILSSENKESQTMRNYKKKVNLFYEINISKIKNRHITDKLLIMYA